MDIPSNCQVGELSEFLFFIIHWYTAPTLNHQDTGIVSTRPAPTGCPSYEILAVDCEMVSRNDSVS